MRLSISKNPSLTSLIQDLHESEVSARKAAIREAAEENENEIDPEIHPGNRCYDNAYGLITIGF